MSWNQSAGIPEILPNHTSDWLDIQNITIMEKEFSRGRSAQDIIISLILVVFGAILVAMPTSQSVNILGFFMIFAGLILLFVLPTRTRVTDCVSTYSITGSQERHIAGFSSMFLTVTNHVLHTMSILSKKWKNC